MKSLLIFLLPLFIFGCSSEIETNAQFDLPKDIFIKLVDLNLKTYVSVFGKEDSLAININYLEQKTETDTISYFLDDYGNKMVTDLIVHEFYEELKQYKYVMMNLTFQPSQDYLGIGYSKDDIEKNHVHFNSSDTYVTFVEHAIREMGYEGITEVNYALLPLFRNELAYFDLQGDFFSILYDLALEYDNDEGGHTSYHFIYMMHIIDAPEFITDTIHTNKPMQFYLDYCDTRDYSLENSDE